MEGFHFGSVIHLSERLHLEGCGNAVGDKVRLVMACVDGMSHFTSGAEGIEAAVGARTSGTWSASAV